MNKNLLKSLANKSNFKVVVLTGAGISAESGIKTFRDSNGLWENHHVEDVATPEGFEKDPDLVYRFYNARRNQLLDGSVQANAAHIALGKLQQKLQSRFTLITQNVDDLHERGGCKDVIHMHGELLSAKCIKSTQQFKIKGTLDKSNECVCCHEKGNLRPDIVWFGEIPYYMDRIESALNEADVFISIGTSGNVYPAAGFVQLANYVGAHSIEINLEPSEVHSAFSETHYGAATQKVPELVDILLSVA